MINNGAYAIFSTVEAKNKDDPRFKDAKVEEVLQLIEKGTYEFVHEDDIPLDSTILRFRFVLTIKNVNDPDQYLKARLVILGHLHPDKAHVVNETRTVIKSSIRLALTLLASLDMRSGLGISLRRSYKAKMTSNVKYMLKHQKVKTSYS